MNVEIVYADEHDVYREQLDLPAGSSVAQAIAGSGLLCAHPEIDWEINKVGVFGRLVPATTVLREHDRIEIYRPLKARKAREQ